MNHRAHRIGGTCTGIIVATQMYRTELSDITNLTKGTATMIGGLVLGAMLGSYIPDIDHPNSKAGRKLPLLSEIVSSAFGHRGFTHSLLALMLTMLGLFFLGKVIPFELLLLYIPFSIGVSVGYASHLFLDMLTESGIPLSYPFMKRSFRFAKLYSGLHDPFVAAAIILFTIIYMVWFSLKYVV